MRMAEGRIGIARIAAFVAALVLVLQSALAIAAPSVQRDIFGNVICAEGSTGHSPSGQGHDGGHLPDCCMFACSIAFQSPADLPAETIWPAVVLVDEPASYPTPTPISPHERRTPANPRAPPAV